MSENGEDKVEVIDQEDPQKEIMNIEDFATDPINSGKINIYRHCRRMQYGHPVPHWSVKCLIEKIKDDDTLSMMRENL